MRIRIVSQPPGEAPPEIRDAWVGTVLDLPPERHSSRRFWTMGVRTMPRSRIGQLFAILCGRAKRESGFAVSAHEAVETLAETSPAAARWWRENLPHLIQPGQYFVFSESSCEAEGAVPPNKSLERTRER
jgi:hypothetical protein